LKIAIIFLLLAAVPLGLPLQLARQTITFSFFIIIISFFYKFRKFSFLLGTLFILISHFGSLLISFIYHFLNNKKFIYLLFFIILMANIFAIFIGPIDAISQIFSLIEVDPFPNIYLNLFILFVLFYSTINFKKLNLNYYVFLMALILYSYQPYNFLTRIIFGIDFFIFPVVFLLLISKWEASLFYKYFPIYLFSFLLLIVKFIFLFLYDL
jgi:hypothetical protein